MNFLNFKAIALLNNRVSLVMLCENNKTMEDKQTAVEWFVKMLYSPVCNGFKGGTREIPYDIIQQAKAMEKEQILNACHHGVDYDKSPYKNAEEYYNETYNKQ